MFDLAQEVGLRSRRSHRFGRQQRNRVDERDLEPRHGLRQGFAWLSALLRGDIR